MTFLEFFFLMLIWIPLIMIWVFSLLDIFRRDDISGGWKALWVAVVILIPFLGTLIYLLTRRPGATEAEREAMDEAGREFVQRYSSDSSPADQLKLLSDLHDAGKISDEEFARSKAQIVDA